jgi:hypothetical protein
MLKVMIQVNPVEMKPNSRQGSYNETINAGVDG